MKLIVGLGNPGKEYAYTRHNFGFLVLDVLAEKYQAKFGLDKRFKAEIAEIFVDGQKVMLAKPQTFMNNSGDSIREIVAYFDISTDRVWVVYDDIDLELGTVRVRTEGTSGGHKGLQSIIDHIGTKEITRFRLGIKSEFCDELSTEDVVLQRFAKPEEAKVQETIDKAIKLIEKAIKDGVEHVSI